VTLSIVGALAIGAVSVFGLPKIIADQVADLPESIQNIANQVQPKPVTIFDPPKYSIDDADSIWVVINKQRQIFPLRYQPASLAFPAFAKPKQQNPFGLQLREEAAIAVAEAVATIDPDPPPNVIPPDGEVRDRTVDVDTYLWRTCIRAV
jgi:hypothetical protein